MKRQPQTVIAAEFPAIEAIASRLEAYLDNRRNHREHPSMKLQARTVIPTGASRLSLPHSLPVYPGRLCGANGSACAVEESLFDVRTRNNPSSPLQLLAVDRKPCKEPETTTCP